MTLNELIQTLISTEQLLLKSIIVLRITSMEVSVLNQKHIVVSLKFNSPLTIFCPDVKDKLIQNLESLRLNKRTKAGNFHLLRTILKN